MEESKEEKELKLEDYIVGSLPTVFYIPNFITESEHAQLLHHIYEVPPSRWKSLKNRRLQNWGGLVHEKGLLPQELPPWLTKITQKICQQTSLFPSAINHVLVNEYLPDQGIMPHQDGPAYFPVVAILSLGSPVVIDFTPHQRLKECTSNEIKTEESMELRAGKTETDGSSNVALCREEDDPRDCSLLLTPCSLLIFKDQAYSDYLHGIQDTELHRLDKVVNISGPELTQLNSDCSQEEVVEFSGIGLNGIFRRTSTRVSLTCRLVLKVRKNLFKF
ncbi:alkylated DNA repair protein ALKBH6 homolog isoform X1 [Typha angustifolia]|uniref:alkylated DNA repair protein ALKBH6 homolog isoform X1 n=1 Tax=Typha angustifolia TaxID=59011 RepID=UPI003C2C96CF